MTTLWIINIILGVFACILAFNIVEPKGFWGIILFLIVWGVLARAIYAITSYIYMIILSYRKE